MIQLLPYVVILLIFFSGAVIYKKSYSYERSYKFSEDVTRRNFNRLTQWYKKEFISIKTEEFFKQAGIKMSAFLYQFLRFALLTIALAYITYLKLYNGINVNLILAIWLIALIISRPCPKLFKYKSPFLIACEQLNKKNQMRINVEIDRCLSQLKNIAISMPNSSLSSDYIIGEITKHTKVTKPYFLRLLAFWYEGRYVEGQEYFAKVIGTEEAKSLVSLFAKLDHLALEEFISQLELYQNQVKERRKTATQKVFEAQGNIVFLIALISGIIILINFLVVVVGIDTISMLRKVSF